MFGEILRRRDVRRVIWFHTDHWEPWGQGINDVTLKRVESFLKQAKSSKIAGKSTLFYLSGNNYRLSASARSGGNASGAELIEVETRSEREEQAIHLALGELQDGTEVEFQLHLHHEHLTGNEGAWNDLHVALKALTDKDQDERRLHYLLETELSTLRRHTRRAFDRWAFVHGMWALNGSDRTVCQIDNEIEILMQYGCWGDFSFPAARYHCDPTIMRQPYTCIPFVGPKAYDDVRAEPIAVDVGAGAIRGGRFLIWNSAARHDTCSVDCFDALDRQRVKNHERLVSSWLSNCPVIDGMLFIKTHAHSMHAAYYEDGARSPLTSHAVEAAFDLLRRSCDEVGADFVPATVDEVYALLRDLDTRVGALSGEAATSDLEVPILLNASDEGPNFASANVAAVSVLQNWLKADPAREHSAGSYYTTRLARGTLFVDSDLEIAKYCRKHFDTKAKFFELGFGFGELSLLLALSGFRATGYEADSGRCAGARAIVKGLSQQGLDPGSLSLVHGVFPDSLVLSLFAGEGCAVFVSTNVTSRHVMENIGIIQRSLMLFDSLILDLSRFGTVRDQASQRELLVELKRAGFYEVARVFAAGDTDIRHFERRTADSNGARPAATPVATDEVRYSDLGSPVPRQLRRTPYYIFEGRDIGIETVLPRLSRVPPTWLPPKPIRIGTFAAASSKPQSSGPPSLREGPEPGSGKLAFDRFGGHHVDSGYGVFKCLLLDPASNRDQRALEIFRFAAANIVHSCVDKATILPWATRTSYVRPDLLLTKLFLSDQPLALHCDHASQVTAYLLHLGGYRVREILMTDPAVNSGHVVVEVFLPEQRRWVMLDPDFGVLVTDQTGSLLDTAELMACTDRKRDLVVDRVVEKRWASGNFDVGEAFSGQLGWSPASSSGSSTVHGGSYYEVMDRCFRARTEITYRFDDGFEDNRLEKAGDIRFDMKAKATVVAPAAMSVGSGEGKGAVMHGQATFDPLKLFKSYFTLAGSVTLDACPVCDSRHIAQLWRLPQSRLAGKTYLSAPGQPHNNTYLDYLPLLKVPQEIFGFDMCGDCHSIFRNPKDNDQEAYKNDTSKVASFKQNGLDPFRGTAAACEALFPANTRFVVDAACGSGQVLAIYRERYPDLRLFGLELSAPSVEWIKGMGIDAAVVDLDLDDLDRHIAPGTVDFIVFNEAFEHVRSPLQVLRKMFRMLRPGGRIHVTAQYFGAENALQIRVGEPIYIDRHGLDWVIGQLDAELIELKADIKYRVTLEKKA